jgi:hypothetical protein
VEYLITQTGSTVLTYLRSSNDGSEKDVWNISATPSQLMETFPKLDPNVKALFLHATDIKK